MLSRPGALTDFNFLMAASSSSTVKSDNMLASAVAAFTQVASFLINPFLFDFHNLFRCSCLFICIVGLFHRCSLGSFSFVLYCQVPAPHQVDLLRADCCICR